MMSIMISHENPGNTVGATWALDPGLALEVLGS